MRISPLEVLFIFIPKQFHSRLAHCKSNIFTIFKSEFLDDSGDNLCRQIQPDNEDRDFLALKFYGFHTCRLSKCVVNENEESKRCKKDSFEECSLFSLRLQASKSWRVKYSIFLLRRPKLRIILASIHILIKKCFFFPSD